MTAIGLVPWHGGLECARHSSREGLGLVPSHAPIAAAVDAIMLFCLGLSVLVFGLFPRCVGAAAFFSHLWHCAVGGLIGFG